MNQHRRVVGILGRTAALVWIVSLAGFLGLPEASAAPDGVIEGVVVDEQGAPLADVRVEARGINLGQFGPVPTRTQFDARFATPRSDEVFARTTTGVDGRFRLTGLKVDVRYCTVGLSPGANLQAVHGSCLTATGSTGDVRLIARSGRMLRGRVVDAVGRGVRALVTTTWLPDTPVWGAWWYHGSGHLHVDVPTDEQGAFALRVPRRGTLVLMARAPGLAERTILLGAGRPEDETIRLALLETPGAVAEGRVFGADGKPLAGARLFLAVREGQDRTILTRCVAMATTTEDGAWRVEGIPEGRVENLGVAAAGHLLFHRHGLDVPLVVGRPWRIDVALVRGATLTGRVVDDAGLPVADAEVSAMGPWAYTQRYPGPKTKTDRDGRYVLADVPPEEGSITIQAARHYAPPKVGQPGGADTALAYGALQPGERRTLDFTLRRGRSLRGRVLSQTGYRSGART